MGDFNIKPAEVGEKTQYLVHEYNDNMVRFLLHYPGMVDAQILRKAIRTIVDRVEVLHSSFFTDAIKAYWQVNENYADADFFLYEKMDGNITAATEGYFTRHIDSTSKVQLRCHLVQNEKESVFVLIISHLCMDGGDGRYLLEKVAEAYNMISEKGTAAGLTIKNGSRSPRQAYEKLSIKDYLSLFRSPISKVKSVFPYPTKETGEARLCKAEISAKTMNAARIKAKEAGATVNDVLLAACYHAYATLPGIDAKQPMSIMSMFDLRKHCKGGDSQGLCNMSGSLSTTLSNGVGETFLNTLCEIVKQTKAIKENPLAGLEGVPLLYGISGSLPMGVLLRIAGYVYGSFSIGVTNMGNLNGEFVRFDKLTPDNAIFGGPLKKKPAMQVSIISLDAKCTLSATGDFTAEDAMLIQQMLDRMVGEIRNWSCE